MACLNAGAVCGSAVDSKIINCASDVNISYQYGEPTGEVQTTALHINFAGGGMAGTVDKTTIENCCNYGDVSPKMKN